MSFFSNIFKPKSPAPEPEIQFGRFTDSYKSPEKYHSWSKSVEYFENEKYYLSYKHFLDYLSVDGQKNVIYQTNNGIIRFSIYQGSKVIQGQADFSKVVAEAKIVQADHPAYAMMLQLLENNYHLRYTRYSLSADHCICLKFDTYVEDGTPQKIYLALKELATEADRKDDLLLHQYDGINAINDSHTRNISIVEKRTKYDFFIQSCREVVRLLYESGLDEQQYPGGISFLLLDLLYKIDYLIKPEGNIMEIIRTLHGDYFNDNMLDVYEKNKRISSEIKKMPDITFDEFGKELYEVNSTFGASLPEGHQRLVETIDAQMTDFVWYYENGYLPFAQAICGYVAGFSIYSYAMPEINIRLLRLYYQITEPQYFTSLGFSKIFFKNNQFHKKTIISEIKFIQDSYSVDAKKYILDTTSLQFNDLPTFCKSYLLMIRNITIQEI
ncbi:MAG: hypothetical protein WAU01_07245 [Saprospiraceae bacterium]